jgi:hypothetical protein
MNRDNVAFLLIAFSVSFLRVDSSLPARNAAFRVVTTVTGNIEAVARALLQADEPERNRVVRSRPLTTGRPVLRPTCRIGHGHGLLPRPRPQDSRPHSSTSSFIMTGGSRCWLQKRS